MVGNLDNSPVHIKSINRESASEQVYQQMKHLIDTQVWAPGYKIPSENQLASQFGVSRMTIRAATQKLKAFGLLSIRSGSGSYVEAPTLESYVGSISSGVSPNTLEEVYSIRYYLEQAAVELAVKNATAENLEEFKSILDKLIDAAANDPENFRKYDLDFHRYINIMSGNQLLLTMFSMTEALFATQMDKFDSNIPAEDLRDGRISFHVRLYNAIVDRDVDACLRHVHWYRNVSEAKRPPDFD